MTTGIDEKSKLELLRERFGALAGPLESDLGKEWFPRLKRSKDYYEEHSADWDELRAFFAKPYEELQVTTDSGTATIRIKISLMWSMGKNHVSDLHFKNPEPWIRTRRGRDEREFDRAINDVAAAMHDNANSEQVTRKCLTTGLYQGGGISAWMFEQDGYWQNAPQLDEYGEQTLDENGEPMMQTEEVEGDDPQPVQEFAATSQRVINQFVPLSQCWLDPDGRDWNFCDSKYFVRRYKRMLQDIVDDKKHYDDDGKKRLVNAITDSYSSKLSMGADRESESNPSFIPIEICEIWDKTTLQIIHVPIIAGEIAKFAVGSYPWPRALGKVKKFPFRMIAEDWNPPDKDGREGIYPTPLLRHARGLVEDIIRLYELAFVAGAKVVDKWVAYEGVLKSDNFVHIMGTDSDQITLLDPQGTRIAYGGGITGSALPAPSEVLQRLDRGADKLAQAVGFANLIQAAKQELWEIFGQGPADRGGVAPGTTATEIAKMTAKLEQRMGDAEEEIGKAYDDGTELGFLLLAEYQTLPIPYQMTTGSFGEKRWAEFNAELLYGLDLVYSHVTGTSRPKNRQMEQISRKDFIASYLPFVDSKRQKVKLGLWAAEAYDTTGLNLQQVFEDPAPDVAKELLALNTMVSDNPKLALRPDVIARKEELQTMLIEAVLSEADFEEVALQTAGASSMGTGGGAGAARGAAPKSMTSGEMAAAGAAAGMAG